MDTGSDLAYIEDIDDDDSFVYNTEEDEEVIEEQQAHIHNVLNMWLNSDKNSFSYIFAAILRIYARRMNSFEKNTSNFNDEFSRTAEVFSSELDEITEVLDAKLEQLRQTNSSIEEIHAIMNSFREEKAEHYKTIQKSNFRHWLYSLIFVILIIGVAGILFTVGNAIYNDYAFMNEKLNAVEVILKKHPQVIEFKDNQYIQIDPAVKCISRDYPEGKRVYAKILKENK